MSYKYDKLLGKIVEVYRTQERFASAMNMSPQTLSKKLNNCSDWRRDEIRQACDLLGISRTEMGDYFFVYA